MHHRRAQETGCYGSGYPKCLHPGWGTYEEKRQKDKDERKKVGEYVGICRVSLCLNYCRKIKNQILIQLNHLFPIHAYTHTHI